MKKSTWIKLLIGFLCIVVALLSFIFYFLLFGDVDLQRETINQTFTKQFQEINIENDVGEINIECWNKNTFALRVEAKQEELTINTDQETLDITVKQNKFLGIHTTQSNDMKLMIPSSYEGKIIINNHVGDINIDVTNATIDATSNVGDISIKQGKNLILNSNVGDIDIGKGIDSIDIESDTGDVDIDELCLTKNSSIIGNLGDIEVKTMRDVYIDSKTSTGEVDINNNDKNASVTLKIKTSMGDITVN